MQTATALVLGFSVLGARQMRPKAQKRNTKGVSTVTTVTERHCNVHNRNNVLKYLEVR
jgi:hypothetical protein